MEVINLGIVINNKGEVLIIKRKISEKGKSGKILVWAFPVGKQESGETRESAVEREVLMETGYKVKAVKQINIRIHPDTGALVVYHLCELLEENQIQPPSEPHEIEEIKWIKKEEIKNYFTTDIDPQVQKLLGI
jgi:ADP-ribose pyrophosphatase YjhB (NUDIX family)